MNIKQKIKNCIRFFTSVKEKLNTTFEILQIVIKLIFKPFKEEVVTNVEVLQIVIKEMRKHPWTHLSRWKKEIESDISMHKYLFREKEWSSLFTDVWRCLVYYITMIFLLVSRFKNTFNREKKRKRNEANNNKVH